MPETTGKPASDYATLAWNELAQRADALIAAWQGDDLPPDLARFLPAEPEQLRRLVLTELVKIDLEYRWQHHELPKQIEEYVDEFPELAPHGQVPCDLIYEELHVRCQTADPPSPESYYARFPRQAEQLRRMLGIEPNRLASTTLVAGPRQEELEAGQQIDDFDLLVRLGKGSFGSVFLARQRSMQRLVALKISRDRGIEPQTLAQLDHPHIVRVYDQRVLSDRKLQLMYMQHIPGGTLQDVIETARRQAPALRSGKTVLEAIDRALVQHGESPPAESAARRRLAAAHWPETVCWLGARLAAALEYAHQRGVLHRDVKPANVLLAADGSPKLVDFNVSFSSKLEGATPAAYFGGSLAYMSPEQIEAYNPDHSRKPDELDGRSDVYSLGVLLWELLTGVRPFGEEHLEQSWAETLKRLVDRRRFGLPLSALAALPPDLPSGFQQVLTSCLAPNVEDRPISAGQLARQLELCLQPRVQRLLRPSPKSLRQRLRQWPFLFFILIGLTPSVVLSALNLEFNSGELIPPEGPMHDFFWQVEVPVVNGVTFPIAIFLVFRFAWPVLSAVRGLAIGRAVNPDDLAHLRRRALWVGDYAAWLGMALWVISGFVFPAWLHMHLGASEGIEFKQYRNFLASQVVCGWISSTLTFFLLTSMFVRAFYPMLVRPEQAHADEVESLARLDRRSVWCFYLASSAPFVALMLLIFSGYGTKVQIAMGALAVLGFVGSVVAFRLLQLIRADLAALAMAIDPSRDATASGTETADSLWSGTR